HFAGASPRSTSLQATLDRLCRELYRGVLAEQKRARLDAILGDSEEDARRRQAIEREYAIPDDPTRLAAAFGQFLKMVPHTARVVLVLDALNQLDEADGGAGLGWLPAELPPHVKVVASCASDPDTPEPVLEEFGRRAHHGVALPALGDGER